MSSTYAKSTVVRPAVGRSRRRSGLLGLGAVLAGVTAVGAAVAIFLLPAEAPTTAPAVPLPAMDASLGYWDHVDARPAISRSDTSMGFWDYVDTRPAVSRSDTSMGFWDHIDARPAVSRSDTSMGFWDYVDARPAVRELPAMPASMGHWDFTLPAEPTGQSLGNTER